jgi:hypothetical protein
MTDHAELRAEISWLEARNREVDLQRIEAETTARSQAARIAALVAERDALAAEVAKLREALKPFAYAMVMEARKRMEDSLPFEGRVWFPSEPEALVKDARAALVQGGEP